MRNAMAILLAGLALVSGAKAQYPGTPLLDTAEPGEQKAPVTWLLASASFAGPGYLGARGGYRLTDDVLLFADAGYTEVLSHPLSIVPYDISATVVQAGARWTLPLDFPLDLAARASVFKAFVPSKTYAISVQNSATMDAALRIEASGAAAQLIASREIGLDAQIYGGIGLHFLVAEADLKYTIRPVYKDRSSQAQAGGERYERASELSPGVTGGVACRVTERVEAMVELSYLKGASLAAGFRAAF